MTPMSFYSFAFPKRRPPSRIALAVEPLEDRLLLSCAEISGFVYHDANQNGLYDAGETPLVNSTIELRDAAGQVVATTVTNARGFYRFDTDPRIDISPATKQYDISFPEKTTDVTASKELPQFDPALGTLTAVEVRTADVLTSIIKVENLDSSPAAIISKVVGNATLTGPSFTISPPGLTLNQTFQASAFDGTLDFSGTSGKNYGPQQAPGSNSVRLTAAGDLAPYIGTGTVSLTETAKCTSDASGSANLVLQVNTTFTGRAQVIYHYIPTNCLAPGLYTVVQTAAPAGFIPGLKTSGNTVP